METGRGRLAIFQCLVASNPPARLALHRGEELVAASDAGSSPSPRVSVSATPNALRVEIREVTPADEGSYHCTATNPHGTAAHRLYFRVQSEYRVPASLHPRHTASCSGPASRMGGAGRGGGVG